MYENHQTQRQSECGSSTHFLLWSVATRGHNLQYLMTAMFTGALQVTVIMMARTVVYVDGGAVNWSRYPVGFVCVGVRKIGQVIQVIIENTTEHSEKCRPNGTRNAFRNTHAHNFADAGESYWMRCRWSFAVVVCRFLLEGCACES